MKIGQVGDKYEQETDATADKVMRMTDDQVSTSRANPATQSPTIQRFSLSGAWNWAKGKVKQGANWVKDKVNQGVNWAKNTLGKVGDWAMDKLAAMLENVPGWHLLTVLLGKNPITGEAVPRTDRNLVEGMVKLAPMGQLTFQALDARGGIDRAAQWLTEHRAKYLLTNQDILKLTDKAVGYAKDWKMGEAMAVIKIGLGRLFQLGSAALIKFIEIAIEKVLDFTIWLVEQISPAAFMPLTPLVFVFKHGMIGFLTRLRGQGGAKLLQMLLNIGKAITSPGFIGAYLKGIIKGFFVDGLWGTITFLWEIVKLPFTIAVFIAKLSAYLSSPEWIKKVVANTKAIQETGTWLKENGTSMIQDLQKEAGGGGGIQLGAIFNALVSSAAGWVQKGGEKMADQMIAFFSQSPDKLGPALGNTVGTVVGMVLFEVVLSAVTFGGGSAVTATKTALRPIFNLLGKVGAGALMAITSIAAKLRKWISGAAKALLSYISKISRKIGSKVEGLFGNLRKWVDELEGGSKVAKTSQPLSRYPDLRKKLDQIQSTLGNDAYYKFENYLKSLPDSVKAKLNADPSRLESFAKEVMKDSKFADEVKKGDLKLLNGLLDDASALLGKLKSKVPADKWDAFAADFAGNTDMLTRLKAKPELVNAWNALHKAGVDDAIRRSPENLSIVEVHLRKNPGKTIEQVSKEIQDAPGGFKNWKNFDLDSQFHNVEFEDIKGTTLGEFDGIDTNRKAFIEDKSAMKINTINPKTGKPNETPLQWAERQIHNKTVTRIENLTNFAVRTVPTKGGSPTVPNLTSIKDFRTIHFRVDNPASSIVQAVEQQLTRLRGKYPNWEFSAQYGSN